MRRLAKISKGLYVFLCFAFFYIPIFVTMIFSFNSSKSLTKFTGFSLKWYTELINNSEIMSAVWVSCSIAVLATAISTVLGTITAIGLSKNRKIIKEWSININNIPIMNPEIVSAIGINVIVFFYEYRKRIFYNVACPCFVLYALCDNKCVSQGASA